MDTGAIIGIVVGTVAIVILLFCVCARLRCWNPRVVYLPRESTVFTLLRPWLNFLASCVSFTSTTISEWVLLCATRSSRGISARESDDVSHGESARAAT